jgi:hypothetical protein
LTVNVFNERHAFTIVARVRTAKAFMKKELSPARLNGAILHDCSTRTINYDIQEATCKCLL